MGGLTDHDQTAEDTQPHAGYRLLVLVGSEVCTRECDLTAGATKSTKIRARAVGGFCTHPAVADDYRRLFKSYIDDIKTGEQ